MPTHAEKKVLPYTAEQMFDLVADVESYPEFLPWCISARVRRRQGNVIHADLVIGFKLIRERFTSRVELFHPNRIQVAYIEGPFKYLNNTWQFFPQPGGGTLIDFYVDFEFRSRLLQKVMGALFNEAVGIMVGSFQRRARDLYGLDGTEVGSVDGAQEGGPPPAAARPSSS